MQILLKKSRAMRHDPIKNNLKTIKTNPCGYDEHPYAGFTHTNAY